MPAAFRERPRRSAWWRRGLTALIAVPVLYLVAANGLLNSGLLAGRISRSPEYLQVRWASAWSVWPGEVHVRGFHLRRQAPNFQFEVAVDKVLTEVDLTALLERRFQTSWVKSDGVEFRLRHRRARDDQDAEAGAVFDPPIAGLPDAWFDDGPPAADDGSDPWSVRLQDVTVTGIREVWVGPYRAALVDAEARGGLSVKPRHFLDVESGQATFRQAKVFQGQLLTATDLTGTVRCELKVPALPAATIPEVLRALDWQAEIEGRLASLGFLAHHVGADALEISGGGAKLKLAGSAKKGLLVEGSTLQLTGEEAAVVLGPYRLRGTWNAEGTVSLVEGKRVSTLAAAVSPVRLEDLAGEKRFESTGLQVSLTATELRLGEPPADGSVSLELVRTAPFALRLLNLYVGGNGFKVDTGQATLGATLLSTPTGKSGSLTLRMSRIQASAGRVRLRGDATLDLDLARLRFGRGSVDLSGSSASFSNFEIISSRAWTRSWNGKLTLQRAELSLWPSLRGTAEVRGSFKDASPFLALFGDAGGIPRWATPFLEAAGLKVGGALAFTGSALQLRSLSAEGDGLSIHGQMDLSAKEIRGVFRVKVQGFTIGLKLADGAVESQLQDADNWYQKQLVAWRP